MIKLKTPSTIGYFALRHDVILAARDATEAVIASAPAGILAADDPIRMASKVLTQLVAGLPHEHVKLDGPQDPATIVAELFKAMGLAQLIEVRDRVAKLASLDAPSRDPDARRVKPKKPRKKAKR